MASGWPCWAPRLNRSIACAKSVVQLIQNRQVVQGANIATAVGCVVISKPCAVQRTPTFVVAKARPHRQFLIGASEIVEVASDTRILIHRLVASINRRLGVQLFRHYAGSGRPGTIHIQGRGGEFGRNH